MGEGGRGEEVAGLGAELDSEPSGKWVGPMYPNRPDEDRNWTNTGAMRTKERWSRILRSRALSSCSAAWDDAGGTDVRPKPGSVPATPPPPFGLWARCAESSAISRFRRIVSGYRRMTKLCPIPKAEIKHLCGHLHCIGQGAEWRGQRPVLGLGRGLDIGYRLWRSSMAGRCPNNGAQGWELVKISADLAPPLAAEATRTPGLEAKCEPISSNSEP